MSKRKKLDSPGKERFVATVLEMLDDGVGMRELNLRTVARRLGCAHTNAYNYFTSLEDLLWWSLQEALERMVSGYLSPNSSGSPRSASAPGDPLLTYIGFAVEHPEWYRLVWMVKLSTPPPPEVLAYLPVPGRMLVDWLTGYLGRSGGVNSVSEEEIAAGARILHRYIHGELTVFVTGRLTEPVACFHRDLISNTNRLFQGLFGEPWVVEQNSFSKDGEGEQ